MSINEELLERHVLNPESLDDEERRLVREQLQQSPTSRALYTYLQEYYQQFLDTKSCNSSVYTYFSTPGLKN